MYKLCNIRITGGNKNYFLSQLAQFAEYCCKSPGVKCVEFGRQDTRGGISIALATPDHCMSHQKFFADKAEMLGFVCGFNEANANNYSVFRSAHEAA